VAPLTIPGSAADELNMLSRRGPAPTRLSVLSFLGALAAGLMPISAAPSATAVQQVFRTAVDLVPVFATVTKVDGSFATGLTKDDFEVLDDGKPQAIASFAEQAQAISVSVILDTSSSMAQALPTLFAAAAAFLDNLNADDRAMIGSLVYQGPPFTSDKPRLRGSMDLLPRDPGSPVWMALDRAVTTLQPETNRRVIVIYTDGRNEDLRQFRALRVSESRVRERIEAEGVMMYAIGFRGVPLGGAIRTMARRSGGRATDLGPGDDLAAALTAVADELHHQYLLGFTPVKFDGNTHRLAVRVRTPELTVRAREVYVASRAPR
jgi:Ca-activated chloride channel family protein